MVTITALGNDSAEAMDQVARKLGPDAFILSTRIVDGKVEITASDKLPNRVAEPFVARREPVEVPAPVPETVEVRPPSGESLVERAKRFSDLLEARSLWEQDPKPRRVAEAEPPISRHKLSPVRRLASLIDQFERELLPPDPMQRGQLMPRTIIVGPPGSGKSLLSVRLAASALQTEPRISPRIIAPRMAHLLSDDRLRGWARLLEIRPERPLLGDLLRADEGSQPEPWMPQIFDMSDIPACDPGLAATLTKSSATEILIALPTTMSGRAIKQWISPWAALSPRVCLTMCDQIEPDEDLLSTLTDCGIRLARACEGTGIIDTISMVNRDDLARWLQVGERTEREHRNKRTEVYA